MFNPSHLSRFVDRCLQRTPSRWKPSAFSELPTIDGHGQAHHDYQLLAGGLALLLSRSAASNVERDLACSLQAYHSLRSQLSTHQPVSLSAQLLMDLSHEIAQCADAASRHAARRCLARSMQAEGETAVGTHAHPSP